MSTYPKLNNDPEMVRIKTRGEESKNLKNQTEKHDHKNISSSVKTDNEFYKKIMKT